MGKKQHQKDKLYLTTSEWSTLYGGYRPPRPEEKNFRRLPFTHCAISLQPFETPLCTRQGNVYDLLSIVPFVKKFRVDPVTGKPIEMKSLIKLHFHKNSDGKFHCPVLFKVFTENSHIVAIATTGNVMSFEAVNQLNIRANNWKELITDESFSRADIITIQDPHNLDKFNLAAFYHIKNDVKVRDEEAERNRLDPRYRLGAVSSETQSILEQLDKEYKAPAPQHKSVVKADKFNAAHFSQGRVAAGFTSTVMEPTLVHEPAVVQSDTVRYSYVKKNGYVRLITNMGPLNLELYCQQTPRTCENFIKHCTSGYYNGTKFHRLIRNFIVQGGDPTGTGEGGQSIWGAPFANECRSGLTHTGRGMLSMANCKSTTAETAATAPPTTDNRKTGNIEGATVATAASVGNGSQFFITFRSCRHLDGHHTVFGRLVGGGETLTAIERLGTDNRDRPVEDIFVERCQVFADPFVEADEQLAKLRAEEQEKASAGATTAAGSSTPQQQQQKLANQSVTSKSKAKVYHDSVGKYIRPSAAKPDTDSKTSKDESEHSAKKKKKVEVGYNFGSFSSW